jgi:two-component sensor histidine kinase
MEVDRAIHAGLIVSELVTNALKHAFPEGGAGEVRVRLRTVGPDLEISVQDNGQGLPADLVPDRAQSLGLRIVYILARKLGARVMVEGGAGTAFTIQFPLAPPA